MSIRYVHTNLIAWDWKRLADFYQKVFNCTPIPPERDLKGEWLDRATGLKHASIHGIHLRLPGWEDDEPLLEIFQYGTMLEIPGKAVNMPGFGHIAFSVDDISAAAQAICKNSGSAIGALTVCEITGVGLLTFQYMADPEGNCIEILHRINS